MKRGGECGFSDIVGTILRDIDKLSGMRKLLD
jgi:hypothetical protein